MAGLVVFQGSSDGEAADRVWSRACEWMTGGKALLPGRGERLGNCRVAGFRRARGDGGSVASSARGWLGVVGQWRHPETADLGALLDLAERLGPRAFDALDGFFALIWYDHANGDLLAVPDHLGRLHLFVAETPAGVFLATSSVALARCAGAEPDPQAVAEFFSCGTLYEDRTVFRNVRRLRGGRRYRFRAGRTVESPADSRPVWFPDGAAAPESGTAQLVSALDASLAGAYASHPRMLPDLTGGLDSRLVVGQLRQQGAQPVVTCTGSPSDPDVRSAAQLAARLGLEFRRIDPQTVSDARGDFPSVLRRSALAEGGYDALEYAGIASIHEPHSTRFEVSVNGSGGEMLRNYWWGGGDLGDSDADAVALVLPRFARTAMAPSLLTADVRLDPWTHFRDVLARSLEGFDGQPLHARLDHLYLDLRMQCWQGSIASATNQIWPAHSPLLEREVLAAVFRLAPEARLGSRLIHRLLDGMPPACREVRLATGFPPQDPGLGNFWRFVPGLPAQAQSFWTRVRRRLGWAASAPASAREELTRLMATGARDFLQPAGLALRGLVDESELEGLLGAATAGGEANPALVGRLIALESALRNGSGAEAAPPASDRG